MNTGQTNSIFGQQTSQAGGFFGNVAQPKNDSSSGLFGGGSAFGIKPTATNQSSGIFGAPKSNLFGSTTNSTTSIGGGGIFGTQTQTQQQNPSIFGTTQTSQPNSGLFGSQNAGTSLFQTQQVQPSSLFTSGVSGFSTQAAVGTTIKFVPITSTDTMLKNGITNSINTRNMCITAMKQYETKSLEELRMEDYIAGRKLAQSNSVFGQQTSQVGQIGGIFGNNAQVQNDSANAGIFSGSSTFPIKPSVTTQSSSIFGPSKTNIFGGSANGTVLGGGDSGIFNTQPQAQQQASSFFTNAQTSQPNTGFFNSPNAGSFMFQNQQTQPQTSLFPSVTSGFSTQSTATPFSTFKPTTTSQQSGIFGPKTTMFGTTNTTGSGIFGTQNQQQTKPSFFGPAQTNQPNTGSFAQQNTGASLFQNPAQSLTFPSATSGFNAQGAGIFNSQQPANATAVPANILPISVGYHAQQEIIDTQLAALPYGDSLLLKPQYKTTTTTTTLSTAGLNVESSERFLIPGKSTSTTLDNSGLITSTSSQSTTTTLLNVNNKTSASDYVDSSGLMNGSFSYKPLISLPSAGFASATGINLSCGYFNSPVNFDSKNRTINEQIERSGMPTSKISDNRGLISSQSTTPTLLIDNHKTSNSDYVDNSGLMNESFSCKPHISLPSTGFASETGISLPYGHFNSPDNSDSKNRTIDEQIEKNGMSTSTIPDNGGLILSTSTSYQPTTPTILIDNHKTSHSDYVDTNGLMNENFSCKPPISLPSTDFGLGNGNFNSPNGSPLKNRSNLTQEPRDDSNFETSFDSSKRPFTGRKDLLLFSRKLLNDVSLKELDFDEVLLTKRTRIVSERKPVNSFMGIAPDTLKNSLLATCAKNSRVKQRSCRVGFGPNMTFVRTAFLGTFSATLKISRVTTIVCFEEFLKRFLTEKGRLNELPTLKQTELFRWEPPSTFLKLIDLYVLKLAQENSPHAEEKLYSLCESLILLPSHWKDMDQRAIFGNWLRQVLSAEINTNGSSAEDGSNKFRQIYKYLLNGMVRKAAECARDARLYDLAILISMYIAPPGISVQQQIAEQLKTYCRTTTPHVKKDIYYERILQLLSGTWQPSEQDESYWMRALGVIIWYFAKPSTTLAQCVELYHQKLQ